MSDKRSHHDVHNVPSSSTRDRTTTTSSFYKSLYNPFASRDTTQSSEPLRLRGGGQFGSTLRQKFTRSREIPTEVAEVAVSPLDVAIQKGELLPGKIEKLIRKPYKDTSDAFKRRYSNEVIRVTEDQLPANENNYNDVGNKSDYIRVTTSFKGKNGAADSPAAYTNYFNVKEGIMLTLWNFKTKDHDHRQRSTEKALPNSEILWQQYKLAAEHAGIEVSDLKITKIVGYSVVNQETKDTVKLCVGDEDEPVQFPKGHDGYKALLGTPAVKGKAYLLEQHKDTFGDKEISAIEVQRNNFSGLVDYIVYHIGDKPQE